MSGRSNSAVSLRGTPGKIAGLLRRNAMTVEELAEELSLTENAVRAHIAQLTRAAVVHRTDWRPTTTRPAAEYGLTAEGELLFSRAYAPILTELLHVLAERTPPATFRSILRSVGDRLLPNERNRGTTVEERVRAASAKLNELGGVTVVEHVDGHWWIRGFGCPLALATRQYPEACAAVASLLTGFIGVPTRSCCHHGARLRCCFDVRQAATAG